MLAIDQLSLFRRAWDLIRGSRLLWLLGFLAALSGDLLSSIRIGPELNLFDEGELLLANILDVNSWLRALRLLGGSLIVSTTITALVAVFVLGLVLAARAALVESAATGSAGTADGASGDLRAALALGAQRLGALLAVTLRVYGPYLFAAELSGVILRLVPGLFRLPIYAVLLAVWLVGIILPFLHSLAVCAIVIDGLDPRGALDRAWQMLRENWSRTFLVTGGLLLVALVCRGLAHLVLQPVDGVSLLSLLLTAFRGVFPNLGQASGLIVLGAFATALMAPAYILTMVVLALVYLAGGFDAASLPHR